MRRKSKSIKEIIIVSKNIDHKLFFFDNKELPHAFPAADPRYEESLQVINYIAYEFFEKRNV